MSLTTDSEVLGYLKELEKESKAVKEEVLRLCWHMRGSIPYDDGMLLSHEDRTILDKIIADNLEVTRKTGLSFF